MRSYRVCAEPGCGRPVVAKSSRHRCCLEHRKTKPPDPLPAAGIEEAERIADWLEQPGTRLIEIIGDWMWPLHAVLDHEALVHYALGGVAAV